MRLILAALLILSSSSASAALLHPSSTARRGLFARFCESLVTEHPDDAWKYMGQDPSLLLTAYRELGGKVYWRWAIFESRGLAPEQIKQLEYWRAELRFMGNELRRLPPDEARTVALEDYSKWEGVRDERL